jgi:DNA-binding transcriptional regulator YdaS (Cro superfamily)
MDLAEYRRKTKISQAALAAKLTDVGSPATQSLISQWEKGDVVIPAERVAKVEEVTDGLVTRFDLRPDIFGNQLDS